MKIINFLRKHKLASIIITALILGLGGGVIGGLTVRAYLTDAYGLAPYGNLNFSTSKFKDQGFIISNPRNVIVEQDAKIDETISSVGSSLVGIYRKLKPAKPGDIFALENFYKLSDAAGQGFIVTADGWIVTSLALDKTYGDYVVITKDRSVYPIDKAIADNLTKFYFIHVPARDLSVRKFASSQELKRGGAVIAVNWQGLSWISAAAGLGGQAGLIESSDIFSRKLILNENIPEEFKGAVVFNLAGDALGLVDGQGAVELASRLNSAIKSLFKNQTPSRPSLGVTYLDLTRLAEASGQHDYWRQGALIYKDQKNAAVAKGGAAEKAGLREGDIIMAVDSAAMDQNNNLAEIISGYLAGDTVNLTILRQGQEKQIQATLGEMK